MSKMNAILSERLKTNDGQPKMATLAKKSASGALTSFAGIFGTAELSEAEKFELKVLLERYAETENDIHRDLSSLSSITLEVKGINNQAALLHGERIKKARDLLKNYREGAFTAWLITVYGNRQTPYNFLQYYEFYLSVSKDLHPLVETLPRQAIYTLASRDVPLSMKEKAIKTFANKTKQEILKCIRELFPIPAQDKRNVDTYLNICNSLQKVYPLLRNTKLTKEQKTNLKRIFDTLYPLLER